MRKFSNVYIIGILFWMWTYFDEVINSHGKTIFISCWSFRLHEYLQEIQNKKKLLQTEINRIQSEMNSLKMQIPNEPLGCTDPKVLQTKVNFYPNSPHAPEENSTHFNEKFPNKYIQMFYRTSLIT